MSPINSPQTSAFSPWLRRRCGHHAAGRPARAEDIAVHIDNFVFEPAQLTVKVGQTVTWTNRDDIPHTVVCAGKFRSKTMDTDGTFSFTFTAPGEYKYFCSLHPHMTGDGQG